MIERYIEFLKNIGFSLHIGHTASTAIAEGLAFLSLVILSLLLLWLVRFILKKTVFKIIKKTSIKYDDMLIENHVFQRFCMLIPIILINFYIFKVLPDYPQIANGILKLNRVIEIIVFTLIFNAVLNTGSQIYQSFAVAKVKPITGFIQVVKIIVWCLSALVIISFLLGTKLSTIFISLGTISAILILVFQDTIKGFVGGIQLTANDMLHIGDWIVMDPADGFVTEINLTTVKVRNWDNTITTIPTYSLVSAPFTNWRGMEESGGRRIKRDLLIDIHTVKFCTPDMLEKYKQIQLVRPYIEAKEKEVNEYNESQHVDTSNLANGRQQTNLGIFRAYLRAYLTNDPRFNTDLLTMVRQEQPNEFGIPLQIYVFTKTKSLVPYEEVQSDLFDHIIATAPMFDLKIFQRQS